REDSHMAKTKDPEPTLGLRFRRTTTVEGTVYQANTHAFVANSDDAWAAVNRGDADLDPPPGAPGQVKPEDVPAELTEAPWPGPRPGPARPRRRRRPGRRARGPRLRRDDRRGTPPRGEQAQPRRPGRARQGRARARPPARRQEEVTAGRGSNSGATRG